MSVHSKAYSEAAALWADGLKAKDIAARVGWTTEQVWQTAFRNRGAFSMRYSRGPANVTIRKQVVDATNAYREGKTITEIARDQGLSVSCIRRRLLGADVGLRAAGRRHSPIADLAIRVGQGEVVKSVCERSPEMRHGYVYLYRREFKVRVWRKLFPLSLEEQDIVKQALDVDGLNFPDVIELIEDHRNFA